MVGAMATVTAPSGRLPAPTTALRRRVRVPLARRLTFGNRSRFLHAVLAGAAVVALIVGQAATMAGILLTPRWVRATGASVWMTTSAGRPGWSPVPAGIAAKAAGIDDVVSVTAVTRQMGEVVVTGEANDAILVSWDAGTLRAPLVSGRSPAKADEVVLDTGFAASRGIGIGSGIALRIGDHSKEMEVVGLGRNLSLLSYQVVLCVPDAIRAVFGADDTGQGSHLEAGPKPNSLALRVAPGREEEVLQRIRSMTDLVGSVDAHSAAHEEHLVLANTAAPFLPVLGAVVGLVIGLGCVVMALLLLGMVGEATGDYATLAAIGAGSARLGRLVLAQCLLAAVSAGLLGVGAGAALVAVMQRAMPMLPLACTPSVLAAGMGVAITMGVVASLAPLRSLRSVEPHRCSEHDQGRGPRSIGGDDAGTTVDGGSPPPVRGRRTAHPRRRPHQCLAG